ncbi:hypothetical protein [Streptomyces sp. NPDC096012]|uniref:hypothetical protein n=1 Tax=Streptomyces sp. NPDC096012 TaxID=3155684 RepID=UPI00336AE35E
MRVLVGEPLPECGDLDSRKPSAGYAPGGRSAEGRLKQSRGASARPAEGHPPADPNGIGLQADAVLGSGTPGTVQPPALSN